MSLYLGGIDEQAATKFRAGGAGATSTTCVSHPHEAMCASSHDLGASSNYVVRLFKLVLERIFRVPVVTRQTI